MYSRFTGTPLITVLQNLSFCGALVFHFYESLYILSKGCRNSIWRPMSNTRNSFLPGGNISDFAYSMTGVLGKCSYPGWLNHN